MCKKSKTIAALVVPLLRSAPPEKGIRVLYWRTYLYM